MGTSEHGYIKRKNSENKRDPISNLGGAGLSGTGLQSRPMYLSSNLGGQRVPSSIASQSNARALSSQHSQRSQKIFGPQFEPSPS